MLDISLFLWFNSIENNLQVSVIVMKNKLTDILPGRIAYKDLIHAKPEGFAPFRAGEGVKHVARLYIKYDEVDYGVTEDNPVRVKGSSGMTVTEIADSRRQGIDPSAELPCVTLNKDDPEFGKYEGQNGMTRYKADRSNGYEDGVWMDVVEFYATEGRSAEYNRIIYLHKRNDILPASSNTIDDVVKTATDLIFSQDLESTLEAVKTFVYDAAPNMMTRDKNKAIDIIVKKENVPTSTISWTYSEFLEWKENKCIDDYQVDYCMPFRFFPERIYAILNEFYKTINDKHPLGRKINITQHFDNAGDSEKSVLGARIAQAAKWEYLRKMCVALAKYMVQNDWQLPFETETALPQIKSGDDKDIQEKFVTLPEITIK